MTDSKQKNMNLDDEINSLGDLDDLLNREESDLDIFPLEDDVDSDYADSLPERKRSAKPIMLVLALSLLGGGMYAGMKFLPNLTMNSELSNFEQTMQARSDNFENSLVVAPTPPESMEAVSDTVVNNQLPKPSDDMPASDDLAFGGVTDGDLEISNVDVTIIQEGEPMPADINAMMDASMADPDVNNAFESAAPSPAASNIAEMVEIAEDATATDANTPDMPATSDNAIQEITLADQSVEMPAENTDETVVTDVVAPVPNTVDIIAPIEPALPPMFERVQAQPLKQEMDSQPTNISTDVIVEESVEPSPQSVPAVEESSSPETVESDVTPPVAVMEDLAAIETPEMTEPVIAETILTPTVPEPVVDTQAMVPSAPSVVDNTLVEADISVVKAEPVKTTTTSSDPTPKKVIETPVDPRIYQARKAYDAGDYQMAADLYQAVLRADPANTAALTGVQLAKAELRSLTPTSQTTIAPVSGVQSLLAIANANPRDAKAAADVANAYRDADQKVEALNWYRKALQLDAIYSGKIDRNFVYDAMATVQ